MAVSEDHGRGPNTFTRIFCVRHIIVRINFCVSDQTRVRQAFILSHFVTRLGPYKPV
jgi:hypothetical protein